MKAVRIVSPIEFETTQGQKILKGSGNPPEFLSLSQLDFALSMIAEPTFLAGRKGRDAAAFQARAKREAEGAFGNEGNGRLNDDVHEALARAVENASISVRIGDNEIGHQVLWSLLPFFDAIAKAETAPLL